MKKKNTVIIIIVSLLLITAGAVIYAVNKGKKLKTVIGGYKAGDRMSDMYSFISLDNIDYIFSENNGWTSDMNGVIGEYFLRSPEIKIEKFTFKYDQPSKDYILIS